MGETRSLLVCCAAYRGDADRFANLTVKKIPKMVLSKCEWGHDDYSLNVENLPMARPVVEQPAKTKAPTTAIDSLQPGLFEGDEV